MTEPPIGQDNRGDTVYTVVISPNKQDDRLLWNMTAVVDFGAKSAMSFYLAIKEVWRNKGRFLLIASGADHHARALLLQR